MPLVRGKNSNCFAAVGKGRAWDGNRGLQLTPSHPVCAPVSFPTPKLGSTGLAGEAEGSVARAEEQGHAKAN